MQNLPTAMKIPCTLTIILLFPILVNAYTWQFTSPPIQCKNVTLSIQGSGGQPPYSLLIIPTGEPNRDVRVQSIPFPGTSTTLSFNLNLMADTTFVAVVRSYLSCHIFSVISSYRPTSFVGQRQERFWYRWCQRIYLRSPIVRVRLKLLQSL